MTLCSVSSPQNESTKGYGASTIAIIWPSSVSNLTTKNKVDTDVNNNDNLQSFGTPRKNNNIDKELFDTNTPTTQSQLKVNQCQ